MHVHARSHLQRHAAHATQNMKLYAIFAPTLFNTQLARGTLCAGEVRSWHGQMRIQRPLTIEYLAARAVSARKKRLVSQYSKASQAVERTAAATSVSAQSPGAKTTTMSTTQNIYRSNPQSAEAVRRVGGPL